MTDTVRVELGARSYDVRIGAGLLARAGEEIAPLLRRPRVAVLTETRSPRRISRPLEAGLAAAGIAMEAHALPPGEGTKGWAGLEEAVEWLLDRASSGATWWWPSAAA
jgi:3-dehydroquinate synthase